MIAAAAFLCGVALLTFVIFGETTRKTKLSGELIPTSGLVRLSAAQSGNIAEILVKEGDPVLAGQPILQLRTHRVTESGDLFALQAEVLAQRQTSLHTERHLIGQQTEQKKSALVLRLAGLHAEERQLLGELEVLQLRKQLAEKSGQRFRELADSGFVSAAQAQQKEEELLDIQLRLRNSERSMAALRREIHSSEAEPEELTIKAKSALSQLDRDSTVIVQESTENEARGRIFITSPQRARVGALPLHVGQNIQAGETLGTLIPEGPNLKGSAQASLEAHLLAPSRAVGFLEPGQTVWMRYAAYPYQKFGVAKGTLKKIAEAPSITSVSPPLTQLPSEGHYRVIVELDRQDIIAYGRVHQLRPGMTLEADVLQETRKVWEWLAEPILATTKRSAPP